MRVRFDDLLEKLPGPATRKWPNGVWFAPAFSSDTLSVQLYTPKSGTYPTPPGVNIIYMAIRGRADVSVGGERHDMQIGDVVPVDADVPHEFVSFTSDFAVYVIFLAVFGANQKARKSKSRSPPQG